MLRIPQRKIPISKIGNLVKFDESEHSYLLNGKKFISVTTLVKKYKKPFDPDGKILFFCARRAGISIEEMQAQWDAKKKSACNRGTDFHLQIENYIKGSGEIEKSTLEILEAECGQNQIEFLYPECRLCSPKYCVAGTSDLVHFFPDNSTAVYDWKTNKKFSTPANAKYRDKMLFPINNLGDSDLEIYSLQLWCYALMLEEFGYPPKKSPMIFWLNPENKIEKFECLNVKKEAETIMRDYYLSRQ
jgi:hypothetical protein